VSVSLHGNLQQILQETNGKRTLRLPHGSTVGDMMRMLGIDPSEVGLVSINDVLCNLLAVVREGDRVAIFEPIGGG
jgi:sulfur carrier protein ThiS